EAIFYIEYESSSSVYTIDRGTLAVKKIETFDENDESVYTATFTYGQEWDLPDTITAWQGPMRTVTLQLLYADGQTLTLAYTIPSDWEFDVKEYCPWGTVYMDEECTIPYEYAGDGIDYTLFVYEETE